ncbi:MAG: type II glyceraldehyde-3-phosphate dehydrogenase [Candidatus Hodarchaeota archaeon]
MVVKVGINGFGTIGKRIAAAVSKQPDMTLVGVTKASPDWKAWFAKRYNYPLFLAVPEKMEDFKKAGIEVEGTVEDLVAEVDLMVDCSPDKMGIKNKEAIYLPKNMKAIFEGGEKAPVADVSFVSICNYDEGVGKNYIRCVSCNTTGLVRSLYQVDQAFGIERVIATMVRRSADPPEIKKGPINAIVVDPPTLPSHHGPDVKTVMPNINITTFAVKVPTTISHLHCVTVDLKNEATTEEVIDIFAKSPRIILVSAEKGIKSTAELIEFARDLERPRNDLYELAVWLESVKVENKTLYFFQAVHQEAIVVPNNIDALRAITGTTTKEESISLTNKTLEILEPGIYPT